MDCCIPTCIHSYGCGPWVESWPSRRHPGIGSRFVVARRARHARQPALFDTGGDIGKRCICRLGRIRARSQSELGLASWHRGAAGDPDSVPILCGRATSTLAGHKKAGVPQFLRNPPTCSGNLIPASRGGQQGAFPGEGGERRPMEGLRPNRHQLSWKGGRPRSCNGFFVRCLSRLSFSSPAPPPGEANGIFRHHLSN